MTTIVGAPVLVGRPLDRVSGRLAARVGRWRPLTSAWAPVGLALVVRLWRVSGTGYGNPYYAATVRSMAASWHSFWFAGFDPGGLVGLDKPPLAFWCQALVVRAFGFHSLCLVMPSVVAGGVAVAVLHATVRRVLGGPAAWISAAALAVMPVSVATDRFNDPDALLALLLVLAAWAVVRAVEAASLRWLLVAGACLGLGFETKSIAALLPLPALWAAYLAGSPAGLRRRLVHLAAAAAVVVAVSGAWAVAVDLVPASGRPYISGTTHDTETELVVGFNGLGRITGAATVRPVPGTGTATPVDSGRPGPGRLVGHPVGGQWAWGLPVAVLGAAAALLAGPGRRERAAWIAWVGWLAADGVVFSAARGTFHAYYLSATAPAVAAAFGSGMVALARAWQRRGTAALLAPAAALGTGALEYHLLSTTPGGYGLAVVVLGTAVLAAAVLAPALRRRVSSLSRRAVLGAAGGLALVGPLAWTLSVLHGSALDVPYAGPVLTSPPAGTPPSTTPAPVTGEASRAVPGGAATARLISFLERNDHGQRWALASTEGMAASDVMIRSPLWVAALGGLHGQDPAVGVARLSGMVAGGDVRFVLVPGPVPTAAPVARVVSWVTASCRAVPASLWALPGGAPGPRLYDCSPVSGPWRSGLAAG